MRAGATDWLSANVRVIVDYTYITVIAEGSFIGNGRMSIDAEDALVGALHDHNPWWDDGANAFSLPARPKSDFYFLAQQDDSGSKFEEQPVLALVGRHGVGKTTLLHQFINHRIQNGDDPHRFLYLPFDADALYQLQSAAQLRRAVRYYESRILTESESDDPHFLILDDVHRIEHPSKPTVDGWGGPVTELLEETANRHAVVTASAGVQIERELQSIGMAPGEYGIQPVLPEKFRDYLFALYPNMEAEENRVSPTSLRTGENSLPTVLRTGDIEPFVAELRRKYQTVADVRRQVQSQVVDYLTMGGIITYDVEGTPASATELTSADYAALRENVRRALYREVPGFESIKTIADLERLCALAARDCAADPLQYQELVDLFDVDRRTIADSYLPALSELYLLTGITEYDNSRPRAVRLYLRDTGLVTALGGTDSTSVRGDLDREADLARVAAFDHTMRFAYTINVTQGRDIDPSVQYWRGSDGEVDFVFELDGTPVPLGLAYRPNQREESLAAIREFLTEYDSPVGILLTGDTVQQSEPIDNLGDGVVQLPYWLYLLLC